MIPKTTIKVLIVDDSLVFNKFLSENLPKADSRIKVVGSALNAYEALRKIPQLHPDVITLDVEMPRMSGIDFLKELLPKYPLPVILVSSVNMNVFSALSSGAVDFVKKPDMSKNYSPPRFIKNLVSKIYIASAAKVKIPASDSVSSSFASAPDKTGPVSSGTPVSLSQSSLSMKNASSLKMNSSLIAIGASTGGTEATLQVLKSLPADMPGIVITQHMPEGFTKMYAERLNRLCKMEVREAKNGDRIRRGLALIAPGGDLHMKVVRIGTNYSVSCFPGEKVNGHRPSVDVLFDSVAAAAGSNGIGIILTGMGRDGASGLLKMYRRGAYTIGQDRDSCVVYGMPMEAYKLGAVAKQAPCSGIPALLVNYLNRL